MADELDLDLDKIEAELPETLNRLNAEWFREKSDAHEILRLAAWTIEQQRDRHKDAVKTVGLLSKCMEYWKNKYDEATQKTGL